MATIDFNDLMGFNPTVETAPVVIAQPQVLEKTEGINNTQFLDFKENKTQSLTLDMLMRTHEEVDKDEEAMNGIRHYVLINKILDMSREMGYDTSVKDLFAAASGGSQYPGVSISKPLEAKYGERAVEAHTLRRVFCVIDLEGHNLSNADMTTSIAISYTQRGIQVGIGPNVRICHNQCMLSPQHYAATFSDRGRKGMTERHEVSELLEIVRGWLFDARNIFVNESAKIAKMKAIEVPALQMNCLVGMLTATRVACDSTIERIRKTETYPLSQTQINKFTEDMLVCYNDRQKVTLWDIYNCCTEMYKADLMEIPNVMPQNLALSNFLNSVYHFAD